MGKTVERLYGVSHVAELKDDIVNTVLGIHEDDCAFKYHNMFVCYKRCTDIRNLILILEEPEVIVEINKLQEAIHNPYTGSTSSRRPESVFIRTTLTVPYIAPYVQSMYVGVIGFG